MSHWTILRISYGLLVAFQILLSFSLVNSLLYSLLKVKDFVVNKVLINLHLLLKVFHLAFVDEL